MASDVAVADLPFSSGAHWANRDSLRNTGEQAMFRRPPAASSFPEESPEQPWDAFGTGEQPATGSFETAEEPRHASARRGQ